MSEQVGALIFTGTIALFLSGFVTLWLYQTNLTRPGTFRTTLRQYRAIIRMVGLGKVPTLCNGHAQELIRNKGKMALVDNTRCEICTKQSTLI